MTGHIFNIQDDETLVEMNEQPFENEDIFQTLLEKYPNLLAGDQINSAAPRRWLLVRREMGVPGEEAASDRWSLDHLFLDQDAIPTLVEVKRSSDTRIRREVVGQMFDYAANAVVYWPLEKLIAEFEKQCEADGVDPDDRLAEFLGEDTDSEDFWNAVKTNLQAGKLRMLFVADKIPNELRRIIEFLNVQMDPAEVLAVEIKHYVGTGLKTLVPRVIGQTAEAQSRKGTTSRKGPLTEEELQEIADQKGIGQVYSTLVQQLKPLFDSMSTTRSNVAFYGKIDGVKSGAVMIAVSPKDSLPERGTACRFYIDRLTEFFRIDKQAISETLPEVVKTEEWAGDIYHVFVKNADELQPLIQLLQQAKQT